MSMEESKMSMEGSKMSMERQYQLKFCYISFGMIIMLTILDENRE